MSVVQIAYPESHAAGIDGQIADAIQHDIRSFEFTPSDTPVTTGPGRAVQRGTSATQCVEGAGREALGTLNGAITAGDTSLTLNGGVPGGPLEPGDLILIDTEVLEVGAVSGTGNVVYALTRGSLGSTAASHSDGDTVYGFNRSAILGVSVLDIRLPAANDTRFTAGDIIPVLDEGDVWVKVSAAVSFGAAVVAATAASGTGNTAEEVGQLSAKAPDATHVSIPGAVFRTSASAQGMARVSLG